jgi:hypothetical protein
MHSFSRSIPCLLASLLAPAAVVALEAMPGLDGLCDEVDFDTRAGVFDVGGVQAWRGPFEFEGARIVGCLRNNSNEEITALTLVYDNIQARGGGGGSGDVVLAPIAPGAVGLFLSSPFHQDAERLERSGITGLRLRTLQIPRGWEERTDRDGNRAMHMAHDDQPFEPRPELDYPLLPLPENPLAQACAEAVPVAGEFGFVEVQVLHFADGKYRAVGCLLNGSDRSVATSFNHQVSVSYRIESSGLAGGMGRLALPTELPAGQASLFVSVFDLPSADARVKLAPP